ncbi:hypothetical protein MNEG_6257, partial [Monoraphidium neglectum]
GLEPAAPLWQQGERQLDGHLQQDQGQGQGQGQGQETALPRRKPRRTARGAAAAAPHGLPQITSRTWAAAAKQLLPALYDAGWHTSLAAFCIDLWDDVAAALEKRDEPRLDAAFSFASACICGGGRAGTDAGAGAGPGPSAYAQGCCLLPLAEAATAEDGGQLLDEALARLGPAAGDALLRPVGERAVGAAAGARVAAALQGLERAGDGGGVGAAGVAAAPGLWEGLGRVLELRAVYPGVEASALAHLAQEHGAWLD